MPRVCPCEPLSAILRGWVESQSHEGIKDELCPFWQRLRGRKKKQDKRLASEPTLCPVTSARSAGSLRGFSTQAVSAPIVRKMEAVGAFAAANAGVAGASAVPYYNLEGL